MSRVCLFQIETKFIDNGKAAGRSILPMQKIVKDAAVIFSINFLHLCKQMALHTSVSISEIRSISHRNVRVAYYRFATPAWNEDCSLQSCNDHGSGPTEL